MRHEATRWRLVLASLAGALLLAGTIPIPSVAADRSVGEPAAIRTCLADASKVGHLITDHTGKLPRDSSYAEDYAEILDDCRNGAIDRAMDERAVIWANLALHLPHKS